MSDDLHASLTAAIQHRLNLARAAHDAASESDFATYMDDRGRIHVSPNVTIRPAAAAHMVANDPAAIIRLTEGALRMMGRHKLDEWGQCTYCIDEKEFEDGRVAPMPMPYPCPDALDLAAMFGVEVTG